MKNSNKRLAEAREYWRAAKRVKWGILFNLNAFWVGVHYSPHNKRWCINLLPCVTLWIVKPFGNVPIRGKL